NGVEVAHDDDSGGSLQARLQFSCPASGLYRLGVTTALASTSPGPYTLRIQQLQATMGQVVPLGQPTPQPTTPMPQPVTVTPTVQPTVTPPTVGAPTNMIPAPGQTGSIMVGQSVNGRLEPGDQTMGSDSTYADIWQFQGNSGQAVAIQLSSHDFPTYLQLLDGAGNVLQESAGHPDSGLAFTLPSTGTYQIVVNSNGRQRRTGLYTLTLR
ncbi:MAG TPA: PPC domain-containing protein, partial [Gemmatimonadales bacterium]|nr:PPC domain-containing protein [Gemmatimonadales bacterium]